MFTVELGRLWISLADSYVRKGFFERSRDIYEDGISSVVTVRDFSLIFNAYSQFEESVLRAKINKLDYCEENKINEDTDDIELRLARLELLIERRPELVSSVVLRQDPHNVTEWHKRINI